MIRYQSGGWHYVRNVMRMDGSVFPRALMVAMPCSFITALLRWLMDRGDFDLIKGDESILKETAAWSGFSFFVGFLIVFRTGEAYNRFWEGCTSTHQMRAEWFDACSALVAFCKHSKAPKSVLFSFQSKLVRLFSMLHASALAEIEVSGSLDADPNEIEAYNYELIDAGGIDEDSLRTVRDSHAKVELIYQWIQQLIVENIDTGVLSIPPPILSRSFQEIANGMVAFHEAIKISYIPFPFPYAQTCDWLLIMHFCVVPFVVSAWVSHWLFGFVFTFIQVFTLWALNFIAVEIENPFGMDANDIDGRHMQLEMNMHLLLLIRPSTVKTPMLSEAAVDLGSPQLKEKLKEKTGGLCDSFRNVWASLDESNDEEPVKLPAGRVYQFTSMLKRSFSSRSFRSPQDVTAEDAPTASEELSEALERGDSGSKPALERGDSGSKLSGSTGDSPGCSPGLPSPSASSLEQHEQHTEQADHLSGIPVNVDLRVALDKYVGEPGHWEVLYDTPSTVAAIVRLPPSSEIWDDPSDELKPDELKASRIRHLRAAGRYSRSRSNGASRHAKDLSPRDEKILQVITPDIEPEGAVQIPVVKAPHSQQR